MKFANIILLAGIFAAVLPLILHLLGRARYTPVQWGAMMFLARKPQGTGDGYRRRQWGLLLLRGGAIALLAFALARPMLSSTANTSDAQRLAVVIVIDASPSMGHMEHAESRLDLARRTALTVLGQLRRGDQVGLITLGQPANTDVPLTTDLQDIASRLASLKVAVAPATISDGQRRAAALLAQIEEVPREVYIISDRDRIAWAEIEPRGAQTGSARTTAVKTIAIPVGSTANDNAWIESITLTDGPPVPGVPVNIEINVRNGSNVDRVQMPMTVRDADELIDQVSIDVPAMSTVTVRRRVVLARAGSHMLTATIGPAGIPRDDTASLAVDVVDPFRVLAITDSLDADEFAHLRLALMPYAVSGSQGVDIARLRVVKIDDWPSLDPRRESVVILAGVPMLLDRHVQALENFVADGGGLLITPSDRTTPQSWNASVYLDGDGLAPASIESFSDRAALAMSLTASPLAGKWIKQPMTIDVQKRAIFGDAAAESRVIDYADAAPMVLRRNFGQGRVLAMSLPATSGWSTLASSPKYLPLMQSMIRYLGSARVSERNRPTSSTLEARFSSPQDRSAWVARPDGRADRIPMTMSNDAGLAVYSNTDLPGIYNIRTAGTRGVDFVIFGAHRDSALELLSDAELQSLCKAADITLVKPDAISARIGQSRRGPELTLPLVVGVLSLLGLELLVAHRTTTLRQRRGQ